MGLRQWQVDVRLVTQVVPIILRITLLYRVSPLTSRIPPLYNGGNFKLLSIAELWGITLLVLEVGGRLLLIVPFEALRRGCQSLGDQAHLHVSLMVLVDHYHCLGVNTVLKCKLTRLEVKLPLFRVQGFDMLFHACLVSEQTGAVILETFVPHRFGWFLMRLHVLLKV